MKGIAILLHAVRLVLNNLDIALRVTLLPYLGVVALNLYTAALTAPFAQLEPGEVPAISGGFFFQLFLVSGVALVLMLWLAVAWHRYVLNGEAAPGFVPTWTGDRIAAYFGRSIVVMLLTGVVVLVLLSVLGQMLPPLLAGVITVFWALVLFFRMCAVLPAAAIGEDLKISQAWEATKGQSSTILVLSLVGGGVMVLLEVPNLMGDGGGLIAMVYSAVIGWFTTVISCSGSDVI
jgi:hypothetical protein